MCKDKKKCTSCEAAVKGWKMANKKRKRHIRGLDASGMIGAAKNLGAGFGGYYAADMVTENVDFLKSNAMIDGGIKVGSALLSSAIPMVRNSDTLTSVALGWGVHGVKKLVNSIKADFVHGTNGGGYKSWDSYDGNQMAANGAGQRI